MHYLYSRHYTTGSTFTVNYGKSFLYDFSMRFNSTSDGSYFSHCILDPLMDHTLVTVSWTPLFHLQANPCSS